jgi:hypothetical protein
MNKKVPKRSIKGSASKHGCSYLKRRKTSEDLRRVEKA